LFGGDTLLTRKISARANPFARIQPPLDSADLSIVNVETAISTRGKAQIKTYTFRSAPSFATQLGEAGVDVGSLANNHALDFGPDALADTVANLRDAGVAPVGAGADVSEALTPAEFTIAGQSVAVLAGSQIIPPGWPARTDRPGIAAAGRHRLDADTDRLLDAVRAAKASHDVVLVVMHWGIEGSPCPSAPQVRVGSLLRWAGATAVLGAHPHVLQPIVENTVTVQSGTSVHGLTAYSLGNFIWDPRTGSPADTGVLELTFDGPILVRHAFYPHHLDANGWAASIDPTSAAGRRITARTTRRC
jgi:poly-gamma-glutamate capsule biosynthesis protein CapA/YwtB (metallophosphatase superfamily)